MTIWSSGYGERITASYTMWTDKIKLSDLHRETLGDRHMILVKPSSEARMAAFNELKRKYRDRGISRDRYSGSGGPHRTGTEFAFHGAPFRYLHSIMRSELRSDIFPDTAENRAAVFLGHYLSISDAYASSYVNTARIGVHDRSGTLRNIPPEDCNWSHSRYGAKVKCDALVEFVYDVECPCPRGTVGGNSVIS